MRHEVSRNPIYGLSVIVNGKWQPERTNNYETDCKRGRAIAEEMMNLMQSDDNPALFGSVARAITEGGVFQAIETGFCSRLGIALTVTS